MVNVSQLFWVRQVEVVGADRLRVRLPPEQPAGLVWLEAQRGPLLSGARPALLLPAGCQALAGELGRLLTDCGRGRSSVQTSHSPSH